MSDGASGSGSEGEGADSGGGAAPRPAPPLWAKLAALGAGLLLAALFAEVAVLLVAGEQPKFPRHVVRAPWGLRYNEPGASYRHKSADMSTTFRINAQGMRDDRDYAHAKPAGVKRVVTLGDSFTVGYEVDLERCFSKVMEAELRKSGRRVEVLNGGVSGFSNAEELLYLERELVEYSPDVVVVSFYGNDFEDNLRSNLFRLDGEKLVPANTEYVPAGGLGDFLNSNWFFNFLSERSNAFVLVKEEATSLVKRSTIQANERRVAQAASGVAPAPAGPAPSARLALAIFERMYAFLRERNVPLVIQSIPDVLPPKTPDIAPEARSLAEMFPREHFDAARPGLYFLPAREFLEPHRGKKLLYWMHSHLHWTPFSHELSGKRLAKLLIDEKML